MKQNKILVVEDNRELLELIGKYLIGCGWQVALARGRSDCWESLKEIRPNVILLDMLLQEGSGFEIAQCLRKERAYRQIPILAMTGLFGRHEVKKCLQAGCNDVLLKPFQFVVLDKMLAVLIDQAPPQLEPRGVFDRATESATSSGHLLQ